MATDHRDLVITDLADSEAELRERVAIRDAQLATARLLIGEALTLLHLAAVDPKQFRKRIHEARKYMLTVAHQLVAELADE